MPGDIPPDEFRAAMHRVADLVSDYLETVGDYPVLPRVEPGDVARSLPSAPPEEGEPLERILDDYKRLIEPHVTHWNHPGFFAYFAITGSAPGILGESLAAALNVNAMLWHSSPAATELEERVCDWVRGLLGLPPDFTGHLNDTASMSTFLALAAARDRGLPEVRQKGLAGRELPAPVVYASSEAHSSLDKAAIGLGLGLDGVRRIESDGAFRLVPESLARAVAEDRERGLSPLAVVATAGTTSTASIDPLGAVAEICRREGLWLHVDAAYGGSAAVCPELRPLFAGWEAADSIVVNPHKWLFVPIDCSLLLLRDPQALKDAFAVLPEYLKTGRQGVTNLMDYGLQLGKRFRSLKLWMVIRAFGAAGLRERIRGHCELAGRFASWVEAEPGFELAAPRSLGLVVFRAAAGGAEAEAAFNAELLARVNARGPVLLSHTSLGGRYALRLAVGNLKTTEEHVAGAWRLIRETARELAAERAQAPPAAAD